MTTKGCKQKQDILVVSALDLLTANHTIGKEPDIADHEIIEELENDSSHPAILNLRFPFELKLDQVKAVEAWLVNQCRGSIIYGSGTGKTEIQYPNASASNCSNRAKLQAACQIWHTI